VLSFCKITSSSSAAAAAEHKEIKSSCSKTVDVEKLLPDVIV
jgi:hypothetical protein